jgi:chemotaxis protein CheD
LSPPQTTNQANCVVGIGDVQVLHANSGLVTTHALGSCIGVTLFDPAAHVGGMLHYMLPQPGRGAEVPLVKIATYATTGLPELFKRAYELGAVKERLIVCAAGAANLLEDTAGFQIGRRNRTMLRKLFWKNNITLAAEDTGGSEARTMKFDLSTGTVHIVNKGKERVLWQP